MWPSSLIEVSGKWVLTGEHAVLRGFTAIALPHPEVKLSLLFQPQVSTLGDLGGLTPLGDQLGQVGDSAVLLNELNVSPASSEKVVKQLVEKLCSRFEIKPGHQPRGSLTIESTIPQGAGLGSSAALCVALTRWFLDQGFGSEDGELKKRQELEVARELEGQFHGTSSGLDISVVSLGKPITFSKTRGPIPLLLTRIPYFTFHDTRVRSKTRDCIDRVAAIAQADLKRSEWLDEQMAAATRTALDGLVLYDRNQPREGILRVAAGMKQAHQCFVEWGLLKDSAGVEFVEIEELRVELKKKGALEVKLTGSGGGGFLIALWPDPVVLPRA